MSGTGRQMFDINKLSHQQFALLCVACFLALCFGAALSAYMVYGIRFLIEYQDVCSTYSPLWTYGVVVIIFHSVFAYCAFFPINQLDQEIFDAASDINVKIGYFSTCTYPYFAMTLLMLIYGGIVIYGGYICDAMKSADLYTWSLATLYSDIAIFIILTLCYLIFVPQFRQFCEAYDAKKARLTDEDLNESTPLSGHERFPTAQEPDITEIE